MADKFLPTSGGKPAGWLGSTFGQTDQLLHKVPTKSGFQQTGQLGQLAHTLGRLTYGYNAPDINEQRKAEYLNLRKNVLPQIANTYGGGNLTRGAFENQLMEAQGDVQTKLAALQNQRQFELQKLRQEQLPRLLELGQQPSFENHITDQPFNPEYAPEQPISQQIAESGIGQAAQNTANRLQTGALRGAGKVGEYLGGPTREQLKQQTTPKVNAKDIPGPVLNKVRQAVQAFEKFTRPGTAGKGEPGAPIARPTAPEQKNFELQKLAEDLGIPAAVRPYIVAEHEPMLKYLATRGRAGEDLRHITSIDDINKLYNFWVKNPAKRERIVDFFRKMVGKNPKINKKQLLEKGV